MAGLSTPLLVLVFLGASLATWIAGVVLSSTTDELDNRLGLGAALGGMILLAIAGSLPELVITVTATAQGNLGLAAGNLIGGIAIQTMVLVVCDAAASGERPLTYLVGSLVPVVEGMAVVFVVAEVLLGALLPAYVSIGPVSPASIAIVLTWLGLLWVLNHVQRNPRWDVRITGPVREPEIFESFALNRVLTRVLATRFGLEIEVNGECQRPCGRWDTAALD